MLEKLHRTAVVLRPLKTPSFAGSFVCLVLVVGVVLRGGSRDDERILIPLILAFLWLVSLYGFITGFAAIPRRTLPEDTFRQRAAIRFYRLMFWTTGVLFLVTSLLILSLTSKMIGIWMRDY